MEDLSARDRADPSKRHWKPKFFHNLERGGSKDGGELVVDVALRTSAAPTYFPSYQGYVDGGVVANNPTMAALAQALDTDIEAEVDRYIVMPGQATAYMLGMLRIFELPAKATDALGDAFDIRVFHDLLLENGAVSLAMLDARVDAWIVARRAETDQ